jgi:hypothetical protein
MSYTINHNASLGVIELTYSGRITGTDLREATSKCISLGRQTGTTKFLVDEVGMDLAVSILDLYDLPNKQYEDEEANRQGRVAIILPTSKEARDAVQFYVTACQNRGWFVRVFSERLSAINWLTGNITPNKSDLGDG